ncbi:MAG: aromatic-ring-hydroxylating dioxygenase subunit beta [Rhodoferax sp.]|uniref:aromatic-ring-hydroxylating dioxygenase subunit beta n=1 Tax=Rhodoferax sp. TaxID=50421 RepID=UPI002725ED25|nr:aromatic-ring-hydroxylating dioxygenase subunit beta [Rhodoferax sp.]MDO8451195.1 aromatic-ring-hydroxylating dioxygenase subunit beta [Rhodoferax sp.]
MTANITRNDVEEFLYREAALLDGWKLEQWLTLFTDDAIYHVPTVGTAPEVTPDNTLFYIADDRARLRERVVRLQKKAAHVEWPRSRTRHMVTNVLIDERGEHELKVSAAFAVHRFKNGQADVYVGSYRYRLAVAEGQLKIREKRSMLDMDALRPHGRVSILL